MLSAEIGFSVFVLFCLGSTIGSFLHVVAERYMTDRTAFSGRSYCPHCKKTLTSRELVPLFSYILSGAQCRGCKAEIPVHYPINELVAGTLAVLLLLPIVLSQSGFFPSLVMFIASCILLILIRIDSRTMLLPDRYVYALTIVAGVYTLMMHRDPNDVVLGIVVGAGALYLLWAGTGGAGLGFGDVKLMIPLGMLFGVRGVIALLFFSFFAGGAVSLFLLAAKRVTSKTAVPFGPFLAGAALFLLVFPEAVDRFFMFIGVY